MSNLKQFRTTIITHLMSILKTFPKTLKIFTLKHFHPHTSTFTVIFSLHKIFFFQVQCAIPSQQQQQTRIIIITIYIYIYIKNIKIYKFKKKNFLPSYCGSLFALTPTILAIAEPLIVINCIK